jgi:anti-anti-sigma regulatory factor
MNTNTKIELDEKDGVKIYRLTGELSSFSEKTLEEGIKFEEGDKVLIDFENITYQNSAGMAVIISILTKSRDKNVTMYCFGLDINVDEDRHYETIYEQVGIIKYMPHFASEEEALSEFK